MKSTQDTKNDPKVMSVPEVSRVLGGKSLPYIYSLIYRGCLPATKDSRGKWQVKASAVQAWLASHPVKDDQSAIKH